MADVPGRSHACAPGDATVPITDRAANDWPATRWIARVAREHKLAVNGENPGWNMPARLNAHYTNTAASGMMAASIKEMVSCGLQGMYWAHDDQLWTGPVSFDRFADWIAATNGSNSPPPPMARPAGQG
jgi:hypothetical protein